MADPQNLDASVALFNLVETSKKSDEKPNKAQIAADVEVLMALSRRDSQAFNELLETLSKDNRKAIKANLDWLYANKSEEMAAFTAALANPVSPPVATQAGQSAETANLAETEKEILAIQLEDAAKEKAARLALEAKAKEKETSLENKLQESDTMREVLALEANTALEEQKRAAANEKAQEALAALEAKAKEREAKLENKLQESGTMQEVLILEAETALEEQKRAAAANEKAQEIKAQAALAALEAKIKEKEAKLENKLQESDTMQDVLILEATEQQKNAEAAAKAQAEAQAKALAEAQEKARVAEAQAEAQAQAAKTAQQDLALAAAQAELQKKLASAGQEALDEQKKAAAANAKALEEKNRDIQEKFDATPEGKLTIAVTKWAKEVRGLEEPDLKSYVDQKIATAKRNEANGTSLKDATAAWEADTKTGLAIKAEFTTQQNMVGNKDANAIDAAFRKEASALEGSSQHVAAKLTEQKAITQELAAELKLRDDIKREFTKKQHALGITDETKIAADFKAYAAEKLGGSSQSIKDESVRMSREAVALQLLRPDIEKWAKANKDASPEQIRESVNSEMLWMANRQSNNVMAAYDVKTGNAALNGARAHYQKQASFLERKFAERDAINQAIDGYAKEVGMSTPMADAWKKRSAADLDTWKHAEKMTSSADWKEQTEAAGKFKEAFNQKMQEAGLTPQEATKEWDRQKTIAGSSVARLANGELTVDNMAKEVEKLNAKSLDSIKHDVQLAAVTSQLDELRTQKKVTPAAPAVAGGSVGMAFTNDGTPLVVKQVTVDGKKRLAVTDDDGKAVTVGTEVALTRKVGGESVRMDFVVSKDGYLVPPKSTPVSNEVGTNAGR